MTASPIFRRLLGVSVWLFVQNVRVEAQTAASERRLDVIAPGDILRLRVWREPDMSADYQVGANGQVVLPRLGTVDVATWPSDSLQVFLTEKYRVYLNNPSIEVQLLRRVTVTGAVRTPGVYPLDPTLTIADAIALAGGPAPDGKRDKVEIRRAGKRIMADLRNDVLVADSPIRSGDQLYVPTRGWLSRNTWIISAAVTLTAVVLREVAAK